MLIVSRYNTRVKTAWACSAVSQLLANNFSQKERETTSNPVSLSIFAFGESMQASKSMLSIEQFDYSSFLRLMKTMMKMIKTMPMMPPMAYGTMSPVCKIS